MTNLNVPGVYAIEHAPTKRAYVGQALDIGVRWVRHRRALRNGRHHNKPLQRAWLKYGEDAFTIRVVADLGHLSGDELLSVLNGHEVAEMAKRRNLYNRAIGGVGRSSISQEMRASISAKRKAMWADPAFRAKRKAALDAAMANPDMQRRRGAAISATKSTPEFRAEQGMRAREMWADPERRASFSAKLREAWQDPEFRAKQSATRKASWADPETKARRVEAARRGRWGPKPT